MIPLALSGRLLHTRTPRRGLVCFTFYVSAPETRTFSFQTTIRESVLERESENSDRGAQRGEIGSVLIAGPDV